jgi:hypothetical protein
MANYGILGSLPKASAAFVAGEQIPQQRMNNQLGQMHGILGLQGILEQRAMQQQQAQAMNSLLPQLTDPAARMLAQAGDLRGALSRQFPQQRERNPLSVAGGALVPDASAPNGYRFMPTAEPRQPAESDLSKLIRERNALPPNDPNRALFDDKIRKLTTHTPPVSVNLTPPMAGVGPDGKPVFFQVPKAGGAPQIVPGVVPPSALKDPDGQTPENAGKVAMAQQAITSVDEFRGRVFTEDGRLKRGVLAAMMTPGAAGMPGNEDARIAYSAIRNAVEAKLRMETGAAATEPEVQRTINRFMPTPFDTKASADFKLGELQKFFSTALGQTKGVRGPKQPAPSSGVIDFGSLK